MSDTFGALSLPVPVPAARNDLPIAISAPNTSLADPCLDTVLSYIQAVLNYDGNAAWEVRAPGTQIKRMARFTSTNDPLEGEFNDNQLPGLFLFRQKGETSTKYTDDLPSTEETLILQWVFPADTQHKERVRNNIINGLSKALVLALEQGVHPAWVVTTDNADPASIKPMISASVAPVTYSGVALNGSIGGGTINAARPVMITTRAVVGGYNIIDPIVFTGTLPSGEVGFTDEVFLTDADGGEVVFGSWNFASTQSITIPAQPLSTGAFTFGYADSPEKAYGSPVRRHAGLTQLRCGVGQRKPLKIRAGDEIGYDCVQFELRTQELFTADASAYQTWNEAVDGIGIRIQENIAETPEIYQTADLSI